MQVVSPYTRQIVRPKQKVQEPEVKIFQPAQTPNVFDIGHLFTKMTELDNQIESVHILKEQIKQDHISNQKKFEQEHQARLEQFDENIRKEVRDLVSSIQKGDPGKDAVVDEEALVQKVLSKVKIPKPKDGAPGLDAVVNEKKIAKMVTELINVSGAIKAPEVNHDLVADKVLELFHTGKKKLSTKHIGDFTEGMEQTLRPIRSLAAGFRGGGDTVAAGIGVTITNSNGVKTISASASGNVVDNEVVAGSGTTFTLAATPIAGSVKVYALGQRLKLTTDYSISSATITTVGSWSAGDIVADYRV